MHGTTVKIIHRVTFPLHQSRPGVAITQAFRSLIPTVIHKKGSIQKIMLIKYPHMQDSIPFDPIPKV